MSVGAVYVPNRYLIHLGTDDFERFEGLIPTLQEEFGSLLRRSAAERRWHFPGVLVVEFAEDDELAPGRFEVRAEHDADAVAPQAPESRVRDVLRLTGSQPPKEWVLDSGRLVMGRSGCAGEAGRNRVGGYCDPVPRDGAERITGNQREKGDRLMTLGRIASAHARREAR